MKKQFLIIFMILCILLAVVSLLIYYQIRTKNMAREQNKTYENFTKQEILGTTLISLINKAMDDNEKNGVEKVEDTIYYIDNQTNSISIEVKFSERQDPVRMENIANQGAESFIRFYATTAFQCTSIEYHEKTNLVKSLSFTQVEV